MQLLNVSWRVGTGLDEACVLLEEGQTLANAIGDRRAYLNLAQVYGRARTGDGDVAEALEVAIENRQAALAIDDEGIQANAWGYLADALAFAGRLSEAIEIAQDGLARFPHNIPPEEWVIGGNPSRWFSFWLGSAMHTSLPGDQPMRSSRRVYLSTSTAS